MWISKRDSAKLWYMKKKHIYFNGLQLFFVLKKKKDQSSRVSTLPSTFERVASVERFEYR